MFVDSGKKDTDLVKEYIKQTRICLQCGCTYAQHIGEECPVQIGGRHESNN